MPTGRGSCKRRVAKVLLAVVVIQVFAPALTNAIPATTGTEAEWAERVFREFISHDSEAAGGGRGVSEAFARALPHITASSPRRPVVFIPSFAGVLLVFCTMRIVSALTPHPPSA